MNPIRNMRPIDFAAFYIGGIVGLWALKRVLSR